MAVVITLVLVYNSQSESPLFYICLLISNNVICCYLQEPSEVVQRNPLLGEIDV